MFTSLFLQKIFVWAWLVMKQILKYFIKKQLKLELFIINKHKPWVRSMAIQWTVNIFFLAENEHNRDILVNCFKLLFLSSYFSSIPKERYTNFPSPLCYPSYISSQAVHFSITFSPSFGKVFIRSLLYSYLTSLFYLLITAYHIGNWEFSLCLNTKWIAYGWPL